MATATPDIDTYLLTLSLLDALPISDDSCSDSVSDVFKQYAISIGCFPNNFFALDPNGFAIQSFWPVSETKSILDIYVVGLKSAPSNPEYWVEMRKVMDGIAAEDLRLFEGIQKGVQSVAAPDIIMGFQERKPRTEERN